MVKEALLNPLNSDTKIYTRPEWYLEFPQTLPLPQLPYTGTKRADKLWHWGSGAAAILVACSLGASNIKLIGFDLYSFTNTVNNIYKGSPNYSGELSPPVDYSYWEYQIFKLFECYKHIKFEIYNTPSWKIPAQWNLPNVKLLNIENFDIDLHIK